MTQGLETIQESLGQSKQLATVISPTKSYSRLTVTPFLATRASVTGQWNNHQILRLTKGTRLGSFC
jgi:hypothetical protein